MTPSEARTLALQLGWAPEELTATRTPHPNVRRNTGDVLNYFLTRRYRDGLKAEIVSVTSHRIGVLLPCGSELGAYNPQKEHPWNRKT